MDYVTLNNGVEMPILGYGTYQTPARITQRCVEEALEVGYRSIDTAQCYGNEKEVGLACKKAGLPREDLFVTTKLWACHGYQDTLRSIEGSLKRVGLDYIDLLLIHEPSGDVHEIYRAMETVYKEGRLRAIGISNFLGKRFDDLVARCEIVPAVNQVETHVYRQQKALREREEQVGTLHESWSPLACGLNGIFTDSVLQKIADRHGKSVAQVALRFLTQQGIVTIPKSTHKERMVENFESMDFSLTPDELRELETLEVGKSLFGWW